MTPNEWADFWRNDIGVNVIPAVSITKKPKVEWKPWQSEAIPKELHDKWISEDFFKDGMAIICGKTWHKEKKMWLNGIDCDNLLGIQEFCRRKNGEDGDLQDFASDTIVEQHANKEKCHIMFLSDEPIQSQAPIVGDGIPQIEIKSGGKFLLYCSGSLHKDGSPIEIIGNRVPSIIEKSRLEAKIDTIFKKYNLTYLKKEIELSINQKPVYEVEGKLHEGSNRGKYILSYIDSKKIKNPELDEDDLFMLARKYERENCVGVYDDKKIQGLVSQAIQFAKGREQEEGDEDKKGLIEILTERICDKHKFATLRQSDETLLYDGKIYNKTAAESIIKEGVEKMFSDSTIKTRSEVIAKVKARTYSDIEEFDNDSNKITIPNGILNLETLELFPHSSSHLSRVLVPVEYTTPEFEIHDETIFEDIEKNLEGTLFLKFLRSSFTIDGIFKRKAFETVLELFASVFVKKQIDERAGMNLGKGENGKSVFLEYIESCVGRDNISHITLQDIAEDTFLRADLDGMSANIFTDLEQYELRKTGKIKAITSGEGIQVQRKHKQPFVLYPFCKLLFSCNRFPKVYDQTQGFFRRWIIVKWERNFENDPERDGLLKQKLMSNQEEKNKVFSCIIHLSRLLNKRGSFSHTGDWKEIQKEWNENADPVDDFVTNCIVDSETHRSVRETYHFYKEIMLEKQETALTIGKFGKAFSEYFDQDRTRRADDGPLERVWLNIDFKKPVQTTIFGS